MPHILVTNDDGVDAPGILALAQAMRELGDVTVLAPDVNRSAIGHARTLGRPLRILKARLSDGTRAFKCDGTPADCVALATLGAIDEVDLVVAGINRGLNLAQDVTASGTVSAAFEGAFSNIPSIAFSVAYNREVRYAPAAEIAKTVASQVLEKGLPSRTILSVNIPGLATADIKGTQITVQGERIYNDRLDERLDPRGNKYYWVAGDHPSAEDIPGTDSGAIASGHVSITPLHLDLVNRAMLTTLQDWDW